MSDLLNQLGSGLGRNTKATTYADKAFRERSAYRPPVTTLPKNIGIAADVRGTVPGALTTYVPPVVNDSYFVYENGFTYFEVGQNGEEYYATA